MSHALLGRELDLEDGGDFEPQKRDFVSTMRGLATGWLPSRGDKHSPDTAERAA
jgi:hypothetical protein